MGKYTPASYSPVDKNLPPTLTQTPDHPLRAILLFSWIVCTVIVYQSTIFVSWPINGQAKLNLVYSHHHTSHSLKQLTTDRCHTERTRKFKLAATLSNPKHLNVHISPAWNIDLHSQPEFTQPPVGAHEHSIAQERRGSQARFAKQNRRPENRQKPSTWESENRTSVEQDRVLALDPYADVQKSPEWPYWTTAKNQKCGPLGCRPHPWQGLSPRTSQVWMTVWTYLSL